MSTKVSISHSKDHHLYQEIFDISNVYLKVDRSEFEATNNSVMVRVPIKIWRQIVQDWARSGWPESEDNSEDKIVEEWLTLPLFMVKKDSNGEEDEKD
jgi:hypothetical protein